MSKQNESKERLEEILDSPEYQAYAEESQTASERLFEIIGDWIKSFLEYWFPDFQVSSAAINGWVYFFGIIGFGLLVFLVIKMAGRISGEKKRSNQQTFSSKEDLIWSPEKHWKEADALSVNGRLTEAGRHLFLGMLLHFDHRGLVEAKSWKTNGDYHKELAGTEKELADDFSYLALTFDQMTYGNRTINTGEYEQFRSGAFKWVEQERGVEHE